MRTEIPKLVKAKFQRQKAPPVIGTLNRCECEVGNILDCVDLHPDHREAIEDLYNQIQAALEPYSAE